MIAWFQTRSLREKRLILVMLALLALTVVWLLVIRPIGDGLSRERERHAAVVVRLGETRATVAALREIGRRRRSPLTGTLADVVRVRAAEAGFAVATLDEDGPGRVRVGIAGARPAALLPWLARLEASGVLVDAATLTDKGDRSVGVQLTLKARAL
ncbi:type II secretion system protein GspM [Sphingomonas sp.]|jgi:general secretion pathway protein M|uniref:type II secretion system protein GspM n=1 Tax=Sphingomonas sp. TaxID=28214 RepID=UPI002D7EC1AC|nr:type II secretion system protein GspM [Sphingomonas sp.]HEU0043767.1 type II secretion system protein GspM [Sphingomonas sp.]